MAKTILGALSAPDCGTPPLAPILLVSEWFPPAVGGSAVLLSNVYSRVPDVTVLTVSQQAAVASTSAEYARIVRRRFGTGLGLLNFQSGLGHLRLAREIRALDPTGRAVVHCGRALPEGTMAWLSSFGRRPYLCWTHGEELPIAQASRELRWLLGQVHRGAAGLIANSHNTARLLRDLGNAADRVHVVHPGVDVTRFTPVARSESLHQRLRGRFPLLLLSVGRLQARKGHDLVLRALGRASSLGTPLPFRYVVVGDGPEGPRLRTLAADLALGDSVEFAGAVPPDELPAYFASADVFVHPNRVEGSDFEGFGIVFLEAAAAGVAVIGGRSGGVPEAVEDGVTGLLVSGQDTDELRAALVALADSGNRRREMGAAGRARAIEQFTWERAARQVQKIDRDVRTRLAGES